MSPAPRSLLIDPLDDAVELDSAAAFLANVDDDNGDGERDRDTGELDDDDVAEVIIRRVIELGTARVSVKIAPEIARARTVLWHGNKILSSADVVDSVIEGVGAGDVSLRLEAFTGRTADWDGALTITVSVVEAGQNISTDVVTMRAAPAARTCS